MVYVTPEELAQQGNAEVNRVLEAAAVGPKEARAIKRAQRECVCVCVCSVVVCVGGGVCGCMGGWVWGERGDAWEAAGPLGGCGRGW